ncbi:hypothetical protein AGR7C_pTi0128 [Agrobacterium deltaense Zutra 3/1]|uniref:Uncharacterized protein n=4 Tax=Rhizobium/Agrobacterium group TaxID=227290 RepID=A0A2Z2PQK3_RHIRH|nr:hypothetical protein [Rhizobium rhizogenes]ASK45534.1 hypothetical protein [Agrobacterium radiobacter]ASK45674.1 hypothetical protein [Agrobacterium tumefaciens]ASK46125.1 hypothetical protein [Agrobacterium rubi]CUX63414.1 hypothetical protein AGR7C_pTi0128 [Agrobacterium deltaense Zutra 3/1]
MPDLVQRRFGVDGREQVDREGFLGRKPAGDDQKRTADCSIGQSAPMLDCGALTLRSIFPDASRSF